MQREYDADVVTGPVLPHFPEPTPKWIVTNGFFQRKQHATGKTLPYAFTNNVLFRRRILDELRLRFDERWALVGCEDQAFFMGVHLAGYKIVWANGAIVTEWIPPARANVRWLVRRLYRVGNATALIECAIDPRWWRRPQLLARSCMWLAIGLIRTIRGLCTGRADRVRGRQAWAYSGGLLTGLLGIPYEEYRRHASGDDSVNDSSTGS